MPEKENIYIETSAFNFFLDNLNWQYFLGTRHLQAAKGRELFISPVTVAELMLSRQVDHDFLLYAAQNFFSPNMLASPSELIIRYLNKAYPKNSINYNIFTDLNIAEIWRKMTVDNSVTFNFDQDVLIKKSVLLRKISSNLSSICKYPALPVRDDFINSLANVINTYYEVLEAENYPTFITDPFYDRKIISKICLLWIFCIFILKLDIFPGPINSFWADIEGIVDDPKVRFLYILENYEGLFQRGPILEMAIMTYNQVISGKKNRGTMFDSMHCIYAPYMNFILTNDDLFFELANKEPHYSKKIQHMRDIKIEEVIYYLET